MTNEKNSDFIHFVWEWKFNADIWIRIWHVINRNARVYSKFIGWSNLTYFMFSDKNELLSLNIMILWFDVKGALDQILFLFCIKYRLSINTKWLTIEFKHRFFYFILPPFPSSYNYFFSSSFFSFFFFCSNDSTLHTMNINIGVWQCEISQPTIVIVSVRSYTSFPLLVIHKRKLIRATMHWSFINQNG